MTTQTQTTDNGHHERTYDDGSAPVGPVTYKIPFDNLAQLLEGVTKLNKRAKRLGVPLITLKDLGPSAEDCLIETTCKNGTNWYTESQFATLNNAPKRTGKVRPVHIIEVDGHAPTLDGWHFVATLEPMQVDDGSTENLTRCAPGESCPVEFRSRINECDHCKVKRFRTETFVLRHDDGRHVCVGRQCLKDFLNFHHDPHALASQAELLFALSGLMESCGDHEGGGGRGESAWLLDVILEWTAGVIREHGWLGRGKAFEQGRMGQATADQVIRLLVPPTYSTEAMRQWREDADQCRPGDVEKAKAEAAIQWAVEQRDSEQDYIRNVNLIARAGFVTGKTIGIAASILIAFDRATQSAERDVREQQTRAISQWQGTCGKRQVFEHLTCERVFRREGAFGVTGIHKLTDAQGNRFTWFASSGWLTEGTTYNVKATVKAHNEYKGAKETVLTRVSVIAEVPQA